MLCWEDVDCTHQDAWQWFSPWLLGPQQHLHLSCEKQRYCGHFQCPLRAKISPSWEPLSKVIKRALDEFYKQGIPSAKHVEQWGRAEPLDSDEGRENGDRGRHWLYRLWWGHGGWKRWQHGDPESHGVLGRGWSHLSIYSKLLQILSSGASIPTSKYESLPSWDSNEASPLAYSAASESRHQLSSMNTLTHALRVRLTLWTPLATDGVKQNTAPCCWKRKDLDPAQLFLPSHSLQHLI